MSGMMWVKVVCALSAMVSVMVSASSPDIINNLNLPPIPPILSNFNVETTNSILVPSTERTPVAGRTKVVESFHVKSDIRYRFATTQISSVVRNAAEDAQEIGFDVTLPKEAFIMDFYMTIDGKRINGTVMKKEAAKRTYQKAVDKGQSAGHVRQAPRHANVFQVSYNVRPSKTANFTLTYQELLRRRLGVYEHEIYVTPGQPVKDFKVEVRVLENRPLKFIRTPALKTDDLLTNEIPLSMDEAMNDLTMVSRPTPETATVLYEPALSDQGEGLSARFTVQYDVEHAGVGGDILAVDGYFIHLLSPDALAAKILKDIVFVLDVSGSMHGQKIQQLKDSMGKILSDLLPQDRLNIITFSFDAKKWKGELVEASEGAIAEAKEFVKNMHADGGTDISTALIIALQEMHKKEDKERVPMIFFLTDGEPTMGVTNTESIAKIVAKENKRAVAIYSLAYGSSADYNFLKSLSAQNVGFARKIYDASDAALQVASLYNEISAVSIKDLSIKYQNSAVDEFSVTETDFPLVFNGTEIVVCGVMVKDTDTLEYQISGRKRSGVIDLTMEVDMEEITLVIPDGKETQSSLFAGPRDYTGFIERVWAYLTIKQLLVEKLQNAGNEMAIELLNEKILDLSLKYKFVTPLTSMVVAEPDKDVKEVSGAMFVKLPPRTHKVRPGFARPQMRRQSAIGQPRGQSYYSTASSRGRYAYRTSSIKKPTFLYRQSRRNLQRPHLDSAAINVGIDSAPMSSSSSRRSLNSKKTRKVRLKTLSRRGRTSYGRGITSPMRGVTPYRRGVTSPRRGVTPYRRGGTSPRRGVTPYRRGGTSPRRNGTSSTINLITFGMTEHIAATDSSDICIWPKRWGFIQVVLLTGSNNTRIVLDQCHRRRKCLYQPDTLLIETGSDRAAVYLGTKSPGRYNYTSGFGFPIFTNTRLEVTHQAANINVEVEYTTTNGYIVRVSVAPGTYGGLLGDTLQLPTNALRKLSKKKVRIACKAESSKWNVVVPKKKARMYALRGKSKRRAG